MNIILEMEVIIEINEIVIEKFLFVDIIVIGVSEIEIIIKEIVLEDGLVLESLEIIIVEGMVLVIDI